MCGALLLVALSSGEARADKEGARKLLDEGNALLSAAQFASALEKFEGAYLEFPSSALLLNIGTALRGLGRNADAANSYVRWMATNSDSSRRAEVESAISEIDVLVAVVVIDVSEGSARIAVDGSDITEQLAAGANVLRLEPGSYEIVASLDGFEPATARLNVEAGKRKSVLLALGSRAIVEMQAGDAPVWHSDYIGWTLLGAGAAAAISSVFLLSSASSVTNDANGVVDATERSRLRDTASFRQSIGLVTGGLAGIGLLAGLVKLSIVPASNASARPWEIGTTMTVSFRW